MPGEKGVDLLQRAMQLRPALVRMLVTAYADFGVTVDAVNLGSIFRYVSKPIQVEDMRNTLHRAMEFFVVMQERDDLLREKLSVLQNILIIDRVLSLGVLSAGLGNQLRNPLRAVQSFLELAPGPIQPKDIDLGRLRSPTFWRDFHDAVAKQVGRIGELMGGLSAGPAEMRKLDPAEAIKAVVSQNQPALGSAGVTLTCDCPALSPIQTDAARFQKLIEMLLKICLAKEVGARNAALATKVGEGDALRIVFRSDGAGVPIEALRAVFDPFLIRTDGGHESGLTLMGVFFLVHHLGGRVVSLSGVGQGVQIELEIPASTPAVPGSDNRDFITKVLMNDNLWERLLPQ
jgi:two-component system probable response regulator PhcQ